MNRKKKKKKKECENKFGKQSLFEGNKKIIACDKLINGIIVLFFGMLYSNTL